MNTLEKSIDFLARQLKNWSDAEIMEYLVVIRANVEMAAMLLTRIYQLQQEQ